MQYLGLLPWTRHLHSFSIRRCNTIAFRLTIPTYTFATSFSWSPILKKTRHEKNCAALCNPEVLAAVSGLHVTASAAAKSYSGGGGLNSGWSQVIEKSKDQSGGPGRP